VARKRTLSRSAEQRRCSVKSSQKDVKLNTIADGVKTVSSISID
jgi:hypothetical protein